MNRLFSTAIQSLGLSIVVQSAALAETLNTDNMRLLARCERTEKYCYRSCEGGGNLGCQPGPILCHQKHEISLYQTDDNRFYLKGFLENDYGREFNEEGFVELDRLEYNTSDNLAARVSTKRFVGKNGYFKDRYIQGVSMRIGNDPNPSAEIGNGGVSIQSDCKVDARSGSCAVKFDDALSHCTIN